MRPDEDYVRAHRHSIAHRAEIVGSSQCGCFYCSHTFPPSEIEEWVDLDDAGVGQTALCPSCGIDSVIGDKCGYPISVEFLNRMNAYWF
ncbi:MAG TPA: cytoplasmic protein [Tepidisphaeraceae bacterium]|nr:cytoplasmic protein [Tepidisphaeraceae bacterium]